ncbi:MAG: hypothetical protein R3B91_19745 [Planctomycetaceae bacterium]
MATGLASEGLGTSLAEICIGTRFQSAILSGITMSPTSIQTDVMLMQPLRHRAILSLFALLSLTMMSWAEETSEIPRQERLETAVALNYCRAAFHRIRKSPTKDVLIQEQEKILNNLNLNGIEDPEVIRLYTSVLDEISGVEIADRERVILKDQYRRNVAQKATWDVLAFGTQVATAQVGSAIKTGADSWWDYRRTTLDRDRELLKVDRDEMTDVVRKSSEFLDTFWKLTQSKQIPDRWLVRGTDLDRLERARNEQNPEVRLRVLKRMEPFMEAYPPYWYYLARTQQALGQWASASETYRRLAELGGGHFRRDDMLATGLANRAAIEDYLGSDTAVAIAEEALQQSTDVWEANLLCARVLERNHRTDEAEDAILCNLDIGLESHHSRVFQVALYYHSDQREKLVKLLDDPQIVAGLPMSAVIRCAAMLGDDTPTHVTQLVAQSIQGQARMTFGADDFLLTATPAWQLNLAEAKLISNGKTIAQADVQYGHQAHQLRFPAPQDWGTPLAPDGSTEVALEITYPDDTKIRLNFDGTASTTSRSTAIVAGTYSMQVSGIEVDDSRLTMHTAAYRPSEETTEVATDEPD